MRRRAMTRAQAEQLLTEYHRRWIAGDREPPDPDVRQAIDLHWHVAELIDGPLFFGLLVRKVIPIASARRANVPPCQTSGRRWAYPTGLKT